MMTFSLFNSLFLALGSWGGVKKETEREKEGRSKVRKESEIALTSSLKTSFVAHLWFNEVW